MDASTRAANAAALKQKAGELISRTGLMALFDAWFGTSALTGSAGYDLMVWPDIDIHMPVAPERRAEYLSLILEINQRLDAAGMRLHRSHFWDDYVDPHPLGAGLYWGIELRDDEDTPWKLDLWGWAPQDYRKRQARDAELRRALAASDRDLILRLKTEAWEKPGYYGAIVTSWDVYQFVIAGAGDSLAALEAWKRDRS
jgi:hypothetical protein